MKVLKISRDSQKDIIDKIVREAKIEISINKNEKDIFFCSPKNLRELAIGYLYNKGLIYSVNDIISITTGDKYIDVRIEEKLKKSGNQFISTDKINVEKLVPQKIFRIVKTLTEKSELFKETGGVHNALLANSKGDELIFREDVSRNNAVNKIIGSILINKIDTSHKILAVSCRISTLIIDKIIKIGIPVVVSISAPTDKAISLAVEAGVNLIGFAREERMNIYTQGMRWQN